MSRASFAIAYDGSALREGSMDVRDLAPSFLAVGQLFDAANTVLNHDAALVKISVTATGVGLFEIIFQVVQHLPAQITAMFSGESIVAAVNLKEFIVGGTISLIWLIKKLKGKKPDRIERVSDSHARIVIGGEEFTVPLQLMRLYQDIAVRTAAQRMIADPLIPSL